MSQKTYDLAAARAALPALKEVTYFNAGTEGIMAEPVFDDFFALLGRFERFGHWVRRELADEMANARARLAALVNADPDEIAVTRNGTEGVSMILGSFPFGEGDELVIGGEEHPAIVFPAFALKRQRGVRVRRFKFHHRPEDTFAAFEEALSPRTRMAAFSHVSCETGTRTPAAEMIALAQRRGIRVLLDGAQSVGSFGVDFRALKCDYLTGSAHKWLCGPKGTGLLAVRRDRLAELSPAYVGGGSLAEPFPWTRLDAPETIDVDFLPAASRFEYGMRNPAIYAGLSRAVDYLNRLGWDAIEAHERKMSLLLKRRIVESPGLTLQTPMAWEQSSPILNVAVDGVSGQVVSERLWNEWKIVQRAVREPNGTRICCAYWTNEEDLDRLLAALATIRDAR